MSSTDATVCEWEHPCNRPDCARCARRSSFQAAKLARLEIVPLSTLRGRLSPPPIEPDELEGADFCITRGYVRPPLDAVGRGEEVVFHVEPLRGELSGKSFLLVLPATSFRVEIVDLLRRTRRPVGPCVLLARYLDPTYGTWSICSREPDGSVWDPFGAIADDPPEPGAPPVPFW